MRITILALALLVLLVAACSWSVPADPGKNARLHAPAASTGSAPTSGSASDDGARTLYLDRCSRCHEPFPPTHASAGEWPSLVQKYGPRAGLFGAERERVLRWLQANAR